MYNRQKRKQENEIFEKVLKFNKETGLYVEILVRKDDERRKPFLTQLPLKRKQAEVPKSFSQNPGYQVTDEKLAKFKPVCNSTMRLPSTQVRCRFDKNMLFRRSGEPKGQISQEVKHKASQKSPSEQQPTENKGDLVKNWVYSGGQSFTDELPSFNLSGVFRNSTGQSFHLSNLFEATGVDKENNDKDEGSVKSYDTYDSHTKGEVYKRKKETSKDRSFKFPAYDRDKTIETLHFSDFFGESSKKEDNKTKDFEKSIDFCNWFH